jgi:hypothetical protein
MANQNFRVKNGLTVGTVEIANSSGVLNTSALPNSGVSAGSAGNTTTIPVVTVDAKGLVTGLSTASVSGVSSFNYTTSNATFSLGTGDGTTYAQTIPYANTTIPGVIKLGDLLSVNATGFVSVAESSIDIHNLSGYVANENIDHTSVTLTAGDGITGGGTIASNRTFTIQANTGITANSTGVFTNDSEIVHDSLSGFEANEHINHTAVTLTAGNGLTGGGTIAASRTFTIGQGTGITVTANAIETNDSEIDHDSLSGFVANEHINHTAVTLTAGNGLTGGGTIAASRTFAVTGGTGVTSNATGVHIGQDVATTSSVTFDDVDVDGDLRDGSNRVFKVYDSSGTLVWG